MTKKNNPEKQLEKFIKSNFLGELEDVIIFQNQRSSSYIIHLLFVQIKNQNQ